MEVFTIILTVVSVIAAVLQIILFFKVWGMCNDIKAIREKECPMTKEEKESDNSWLWMLFIFAAIIILIVVLATNN